jgi:hypothetical protein
MARGTGSLEATSIFTGLPPFQEQPNELFQLPRKLGFPPFSFNLIIVIKSIDYIMNEHFSSRGSAVDSVVELVVR